MYIKNFTFLPFIDNMDISVHSLCMNIAIRDDLKLYSTLKHIQCYRSEIDQETFKQVRDIKSPIPEDMLLTSETPEQPTDDSTTAKSADENDEIIASQLLTRQIERGRCREVKSFSSLFASDTSQELIYVQLDDLTTKDVFLSSIIQWTFSKKDLTQPKTPVETYV